MIDPTRRQAEFYQRNEAGYYQLALPDDRGVYHSLSITGFWLKVDWLWQSPLPNELQILGQLGVLEG